MRIYKLLIKYFLPILIVLFGIYILKFIDNTKLQEYQTYVSILLVLIGIPIALWINSIREDIKQKKFNDRIKLSLLHELWINLDLVQKIKECHEESMKSISSGSFVRAWLPPRLTLLDKIISLDSINNINFNYLETGLNAKLLESYAQLKWIVELLPKGEEYYINCMGNKKGFSKDFPKVFPEILNKTLSNMFYVWVFLVEERGKSIDSAILKKFYTILKEARVYAKNKNKKIAVVFRSKEVNGFEDKDKISTIICWENNLDNQRYSIVIAKEFLPKVG